MDYVSMFILPIFLTWASCQKAAADSSTFIWQSNILNLYRTKGLISVEGVANSDMTLWICSG